MSSNPELTPKPTRRSGRSRKSHGASNETPNPQQSNQQTLNLTNSASDITQAGFASYDGASDAQYSDHPPNPPNYNPSTPGRPQTRQASSKKAQTPEGSGVTHNQPRAKANNRTQSEKHQVPLNPTHNKTPSAVKKAGSLTPGPFNETPSKAYAGPTFHASPAASSLPLPKFFSKSVPNVDKTTSLKSMMGQEAADTASESEGSPFVEKAEPVLDRAVREESPLDIFFQADRRDKARLRSQTPEQSLGRPISRQSAKSGASPSRANLENRHHSRHPTDGSIGGVFPLEMDGSSPKPPFRPPLDNRPSHGQAAPAPNADNQSVGQNEEDKRNAQTLALKQMLFSPRFQQDQPVSERSSSTPNGAALSPSKTPHHQISPSRKSPAPIGLASDESRAKRHTALLALAQKQLPNQNSNQRPPSSHLRKEVPVPDSPDRHEEQRFPSTPPSHMSKEKTAVTNGNQHKGSSLHALLNGSSGAPDKPNRTADANTTNLSTQTIEDDLRRILKMDVLGDGHATKANPQ